MLTGLDSIYCQNGDGILVESVTAFGDSDEKPLHEFYSLKLLNYSAHTVRSNLWLPLQMKLQLSCKAIITTDDGVLGLTFVERSSLQLLKICDALWPFR